MKKIIFITAFLGCAFISQAQFHDGFFDYYRYYKSNQENVLYYELYSSGSYKKIYYYYLEKYNNNTIHKGEIRVIREKSYNSADVSQLTSAWNAIVGADSVSVDSPIAPGSVSYDAKIYTCKYVDSELSKFTFYILYNKTKNEILEITQTEFGNVYEENGRKFVFVWAPYHY